MARINEVRMSYAPEHISASFDRLPRLDFMALDKDVCCISMAESDKPFYLQPINVFFSGQGRAVLAKACEAFNAAIAEAVPSKETVEL